MQHYSFEDSVGYWTILTANAFQKALNDELSQHGITFRQAQVLGCLAMHGELSQIELANHMMIEPPTLVGILDRMQRDGWICRHGCSSDRRRKLIRATPEADAIWEKVIDGGMKVRARGNQGLTNADIATLIRLLGMVHQNLLSTSELPVQSVEGVPPGP
jgi:MarR family transcriptional regulator for hemolysin